MQRFVVAKELMHVFDSPTEKANNIDRFKNLVSQIASKPMLTDMEAYYVSDRNAYWKALICLIPPWLREKYLADWNALNGSLSNAAAELRLPEPYVAAAMGGYYDTALNHLLN